MSTWQELRLADARVAFAEFSKLETAFMTYALVAKGAVPHGCGVFATDDPNSNTIIWYFSPDAASIAAKFNAQTCAKPVPVERFSLLVGEQRSAMEHFPEYFGNVGRRR
jgi:hypothetical protein